jgi:hypothetical protein
VLKKQYSAKNPMLKKQHSAPMTNRITRASSRGGLVPMGSDWCAGTAAARGSNAANLPQGRVRGRSKSQVVTPTGSAAASSLSNFANIYGQNNPDEKFSLVAPKLEGTTSLAEIAAGLTDSVLQRKKSLEAGTVDLTRRATPKPKSVFTRKPSHQFAKSDLSGSNMTATPSERGSSGMLSRKLSSKYNSGTFASGFFNGLGRSDSSRGVGRSDSGSGSGGDDSFRSNGSDSGSTAVDSSNSGSKRSSSYYQKKGGLKNRRSPSTLLRAIIHTPASPVRKVQKDPVKKAVAVPNSHEWDENPYNFHRDRQPSFVMRTEIEMQMLQDQFYVRLLVLDFVRLVERAKWTRALGKGQFGEVRAFKYNVKNGPMSRPPSTSTSNLIPTGASEDSVRHGRADSDGLMMHKHVEEVQQRYGVSFDFAQLALKNMVWKSIQYDPNSPEERKMVADEIMGHKLVGRYQSLQAQANARGHGGRSRKSLDSPLSSLQTLVPLTMVHAISIQHNTTPTPAGAHIRAPSSGVALDTNSCAVILMEKAVGRGLDEWIQEQQDLNHILSTNNITTNDLDLALSNVMIKEVMSAGESFSTCPSFLSAYLLYFLVFSVFLRFIPTIFCACLSSCPPGFCISFSAASKPTLSCLDAFCVSSTHVSASRRRWRRQHKRRTLSAAAGAGPPPQYGGG